MYVFVYCTRTLDLFLAVERELPEEYSQSPFFHHNESQSSFKTYDVARVGKGHDAIPSSIAGPSKTLPFARRIAPKSSRASNA